MNMAVVCHSLQDAGNEMVAVEANIQTSKMLKRELSFAGQTC